MSQGPAVTRPAKAITQTRSRVSRENMSDHLLWHAGWREWWDHTVANALESLMRSPHPVGFIRCIFHFSFCYNVYIIMHSLELFEVYPLLGSK